MLALWYSFAISDVIHIALVRLCMVGCKGQPNQTGLFHLNNFFFQDTVVNRIQILSVLAVIGTDFLFFRRYT